ncbi:MAG: PEP/pyruvate-binding domain-containing protein [Candidatus Thermoplasmatota archaeon]
MPNKIEKIREAIEEATGKSPELPSSKTRSKDLEASFIDDVLLFCNSFDYFLIQEEGRLDALIEDKFSSGGLRQPPKIQHAETKKECSEILKKLDIDMLIIFGTPLENDIEKFSQWLETSCEELPVVWISNNDSDSNTSLDEKIEFKEVFTWNGDGKIILTIIQYIEDNIRFREDRFAKRKRPILLIEDSKQYYSTYLTHIYEEIWSHLDAILHEDLTKEKKIQRYLRRPFVVLAEDIDEGREIYTKIEEDLLCVITDNRLETEDGNQENAGLQFAEEIKRDNPDLPVLLQSSASVPSEKTDEKIEIVNKNDPALNQAIIDFIDDNLSPVSLKVRLGEGFEEIEVKTIDELQEVIKELDDQKIKDLIEDPEFVKWMRVLTEFELADSVEVIKDNHISPRSYREKLLDLLEEYRYADYSTAVTDFKRERTEPKNKINRIGEGALGGKARGLAFISKLFSKYLSEDLFEDLKITVPRTIVLTSDVFDKFFEENEIIESRLFELSDERISSKFIDGSLPATIIGDLRSFIRETRNPLIVRSSGLLEDSLTRPFAGVYSSMFLPNESWETSLRFKEVCEAIKHVYASTFFEEARNYLKSTPKNIGDEKMSVIIQEVVGGKNGKYFYPTISGVAKSYNYYTSKGCKPEDGIVYLALGLGKEIVEGGSSYFFCPECPKSPMFGTPKDFVPHSQTEFYALNLESIYRVVGKNEESSLEKLDITQAEKHGVLDKIASTYSPRDDRLYPGIHREGSRVIDFAPIINYDSIPLAQAIKVLIDVSEIALGYPVEIEFAVEFEEEDDKPAKLVVLQIRNMVSKTVFQDLDIEECDDEKLVCQSEKVLGHGMLTEIEDVVYIKPGAFDMSNSEDAAEEIKKINAKLSDEGREYLLVGPGRWGTTDPWMGIPVRWGDIAGSKVIVETPTEGRTIEPSQGSHFFHDMLSSETCYMVVDDENKVDWDWLEEKEYQKELEYVRHVQLDEPLKVQVDGKEGRGIIEKKLQNRSETNNI